MAAAKPKGAGFIRLDHELVRSERWQALTANATRLLIDIWSRYNGRNNGAIRYAIRDAETLLHCSRRTAIRTFAELSEVGLIEARERGGFRYRGHDTWQGVATAWRITTIPMPDDQA